MAGGMCGVAPSLEVDESSPDVVVVSARAQRPDGVCPGAIETWFVVAALDEPLGGRRLESAEGGVLEVVDCAAAPRSSTCRGAEAAP